MNKDFSLYLVVVIPPSPGKVLLIEPVEDGLGVLSRGYLRIACGALATLCLGSQLCAAQSQETRELKTPTQVNTIELNKLLDHLEEAAAQNREHYRAYIVKRDYRFYHHDRSDLKSEVVAQVNFIPPGKEDYKIVESQGNSHGEKVVRHMLEDEQKAAADPGVPGAISRANYNFVYLGTDSLDGNPCYILRILPKRKDRKLIDGRVWVDMHTYLVRQIDGEMAKMPSWWLKSVHVTLHFSNVSGMWMQTSKEANAEVRIFGNYIFSEQALSHRTGESLAREGFAAAATADAAH